MKSIIFLLIILCSSVCYGQLPVTQDNILILVTNRKTCGLSRAAEGYFAQADVRQYLKNGRIQFVQYYGQDIGKSFHTKWKVTHYPALVHLKKVQDGYGLYRTISGPEASKTLGSLQGVLRFLGVQPIRAPQQYTQPQKPDCPPGGS